MAERRKVLVVDDDIDLAETIRLHLIQKGYEADVAHSGQKAIEMYEDNHPDLIIMDRVMPGIDGLVAMRKIQGLKA